MCKEHIPNSTINFLQGIKYAPRKSSLAPRSQILSPSILQTEHLPSGKPGHMIMMRHRGHWKNNKQFMHNAGTFKFYSASFTTHREIDSRLDAYRYVARRDFMIVTGFSRIGFALNEACHWRYRPHTVSFFWMQVHCVFATNIPFHVIVLALVMYTFSLLETVMCAVVWE